MLILQVIGMEQTSIIQIGDVLVSSEIITEHFACDYEKCKGACCIVGESGAPLLEEELPLLERDYGKFKPWMSPSGCKRVEESGFFEIDVDGDYVTPLLGNSEECVYTRFEGDNCLCAIERAHTAGKCGFVKPISCRLYPIRVTALSSGMKALNLHRWNLCKCAFEKGKKEGVPVYRFLEGPLTEAFGREFYSMLEAAARTLTAAS